MTFKLYVAAIALFQVAFAAPTDLPKLHSSPQIETTFSDEAANIAAYKRMLPNVCKVKVYIDLKDGTEPVFNGHGTGFVMNDGPKQYIVTAWHVVRDPAAKVKVLFADGKEYDTTIIKRGLKFDVAFLAVPQGYNAPRGLNLATQNADVGSNAYILGCPLSFEWLFGVGVVSGYTITDEKWADMNISTGVIWGNSGGCVTNSKGEVIGVVVRLEISRGAVLSHLGKCVTVEQIRAEIPV